MSQLGMFADAPPEVSTIADELGKQDAARRKLEAKAPRGFDPAALFLLDLHTDNLYDPTQSPERFTCRGCGATVGRRQRVKHHADHKRRVTK